MESPFNGLKVDKELVCEFFATFSRFEFAIKDSGFCATKMGRAQPDWNSFTQAVEHRIDAIQDHDFLEAVSFLLSDPPQVQITQSDWSDRPLPEGTGPAVIEAVKRVRNNLFHGGKHSPERESGRDTRLVESALISLLGLLQCNANVRISYETYSF